MTTWPSSNKAVTTTTDQASDTISGAREDINKTIANVNDIIDIFNIPSSPTDNASTQKFDVEADTGGGAVSLNDLSDVDTTGVANNKILKYNSTTSNFEIADESGGIALTDISVTIGGNSGNGSLSYNNTTGVFTFNPSTLDQTNIGDLADVDTTGVANGSVLKYNSTSSEWEIGSDAQGGSGQTYYNGGTLNQDQGTFTPNYNNGTFQFYNGTAASGGYKIMGVPTNMSQGSVLTLVFYAGAGTSGQDFDIQWASDSSLLTPGGGTGYSVVYQQSRMFQIWYDGTRYYMVQLGNNYSA
jgi:hypothetical protein